MLERRGGGRVSAMPEILADLAAKAHNTQAPQQTVLARGLILRARVSDRLEVLVYRDPGSASATEAKVISNALRKLGYETHDAIPFGSKSRNGWQIACLTDDEAAALTEEQAARSSAGLAASAAALEGRKDSRLEYALKLKLELCPQHPDSMEIVECWREAFEQLGARLEVRIAELEAELKAKAQLK